MSSSSLLDESYTLIFDDNINDIKNCVGKDVITKGENYDTL